MSHGAVLQDGPYPELETQSLWAKRTSQLTLYREIVDVGSEIHTKFTNALTLAACIIVSAVAKL
jgi:hypothetical protein